MFRLSTLAVLIAFASAALCFAQSKPAEPQALPGAKAINLQLEAASPEEAFAELARQAEVQFKPMGQNLWTKADPVELKIVNGRFWPVCIDMCQQANVRFNPNFFSGIPRTVELFSADQGMEPITKCPYAETQGCILALMSANRSYSISFANPNQTANTFGIQAMLLADPGVDLGGNLQALATEAVDENGASFLPPNNQQMFGGGGGQPRSLARHLFLNLAYPANAGKKLVRLKVDMRASIVTKSDTLSIDSPIDAAPQKKDLPAMSVEVKSVKTVGNTVEVQVAINSKRPMQGMERQDMWNCISAIELIDSQGNRYTQMGFGGSGGTANSLTFTLHFGSPSQTPGKPAKLIWRLTRCAGIIPNTKAKLYIYQPQ